MFGWIIAGATIATGLWNLFNSAEAAKASRRELKKQQAFSEKMMRSDIRLQWEETQANIDIMDYLLGTDTKGNKGKVTADSRLGKSFALERDMFILQGKQSFFEGKQQLTKAQTEEGMQYVQTALLGLEGGTETSAGIVGKQFYETTKFYNDIMIEFFGTTEDFSQRTNKSLFSLQYEELLTQQTLATKEIESEYDIMKKTQKELEGQYLEVGGRIDSNTGKPYTEEEMKQLEEKEEANKKKSAPTQDAPVSDGGGDIPSDTGGLTITNWGWDVYDGGSDWGGSNDYGGGYGTDYGGGNIY